MRFHILIPGNILVSPNVKNPEDPQLVLLDHGLYETLSDKDRLTLCSLWRSIVYNDEKGDKDLRTLLHLMCCKTYHEIVVISF